MSYAPRSIALACALCFATLLSVRAASSPKPFSSYDVQVKPIVAQMTLDEKIGQMTQPDQEFLADPADITTLFLGSVLSGGSSDPKEGNSVQAWTDLYDRLQRRALATRLRIPLLYGVDAVHGHNNVLGAVVFPHNIGLGATRNPALVEKAARITAEEVRATGIQWTFAPGVMVPQDPRWGRTYEGFSDHPEVVAAMGEAAVRGFQGADLANPLSVLACAKHFVGDGGTAFDSAKTGLDQGDMRVDEATLRRVHLPGYITAIKAGVGSIMPSYSSWNGVKCSGNKHLLTDILKQELGFEGFLISDYDAVDQITRDYKEAIGISINAGMDMVMVPKKYKLFIANLKALVNEGTVPMSRIDDAVTRILRVKAAMGLLDPNRQQLADRGLQRTFGSDEHRAVARQAVRESLVLLKNQSKTLPLKKSVARIHVAGKSADDLGNQCGGWTIDWQGKSGNLTPGGTTLLAAMKKVASNVTYSADGTGAKGATVGVVVIGEQPYAEMKGDRHELSLAPEDIAAVNNMKAAGIPVVVILYSGRPMTLGPVFDKADALIAAWLPGTEGEGITDVLFGDHKPKGKLSYNWEKQFPFGFGLSW
jgi:beta-glucosidase